ncbi:MAG: 2-phospho-L-lactate transferase [Conexivisphaera sp.]
MVVLAGGVGAARFLSGLASILDPRDVTAVVNVGDDVELLGLRISPDLDIVTYTLAGIVDESKGWGIRGDTFSALARLRNYGADAWMALGDGDLATHIYRTARLREGASLSEVTEEIRVRLGVKSRVLPVTDDRLTTMIRLRSGQLISFEEYYVRHAFRPRISGLTYAGCSSARPARGVLEAIESADALMIAPSNPVASVMPILCVEEVARAVRRRRARVAVSPIVGGRAVKGPAAQMMSDLGMEPSPVGVAKLYRGFLDAMILDSEDSGLVGRIAEEVGVRAYVTDTMMVDQASRRRLAEFAVGVARELRRGFT